MKSRMRGGGGSSSLKFILQRRIQSLEGNLAVLSVEEVADCLRSRYPDYRRLQLQSFTKSVLQTLEHLKSKAQKSVVRLEECESEEDLDDGVGTTNITSRGLGRKRRKGLNVAEERSARLETEYLRKHKKKFVSSTPSSSSIEQDEAGSNSDEGSLEPKFDLMKCMIRSNYAQSSLKPVAEKADEKIFEVDVDYKEKQIDSAAANWNGNAKKSDKKNSKGLSGMGVKEKEGPLFCDFGGMKSILEELQMQVMGPFFYQPHLLKWLGVKPMTGLLLHGPPGCGKTKLAHAIANEAGVPFYKISATQVISGVSGESEENIRNLFSKAYRTAPSIVFIDEIDAIGSKRENLQREMERRVVTQLLTCMDELHQTGSGGDSNSDSSEQTPSYVLVIGATNRPEALDPALRRPGRFDREIPFSVPDENARADILSVLTQNLRLEGTFDMKRIARATPGFVGADLASVVNTAGNLAIERIMFEKKSRLLEESKDKKNSLDWLKNPWPIDELEGLNITMADFEKASKIVQPSSTREGFSSIPDVKWEDIGGMKSLREEFNRHIVGRIKSPEDYEEFGEDSATGILLYGPPGCGKTLIAKAVANEASANFIHVKGPELLSKYVGDSELAVRTIFSRARAAQPCIIFFDEIDALTTERGKDGGWVVERLLNQLLIELDGADRRRGVYVIGATNRVEVMDRAVLRPGRLGMLLYVPLPGPDERVLILKTLARKRPLAADVDLDAIGHSEACQNLSGADLAAVVSEAAILAMEEKSMALRQEISSTEQWVIKTLHFEKALKKISPSVSAKQTRDYEAVSQSFKMA